MQAFQASLIFAIKAGAYLSGALLFSVGYRPYPRILDLAGNAFQGQTLLLIRPLH